MTEQNNQPLNIDDQIDKLKAQRKRLESLLSILRKRSAIWDAFTSQYIDGIEIRRSTDSESMLLSQHEFERLQVDFGIDFVNSHISDFNARLANLRTSGVGLTIDEMEKSLKEIDGIIVELIRCRNLIRKDDVPARINAKDILIKRVGPIAFGVGLIALDLDSQDWKTIVAGYSLIFKGIE